MTLFDATTNHFWGATPVNADEIARTARLALWASKQPQAVHYHAADESCVRGGSCYMLRLPDSEPTT